jgi:cell division transport system permease protein
MPVSADYIARETASNLWRNRLMTVAAVLTVAVSLSLVGVALLLQQGTSNAAAQWERGTKVIVWMKADSTLAEQNAVKTQLTELAYVSNVVYRSQTYDYVEAKHFLSPDEYASLSPASMPSSFRVTPAQLQDAQLVVQRFSGQPGVDRVSSPQGQIRTEETVITWLKWVFIGVALVLLLSAAVLILNTIRMAIFARRREVSVMKLVGATNWFIRLPFMSEGLIQGLLGSAVAASLVLGLRWLIDHFTSADQPGSLFYQIRPTGWQVFVTDLIVVILGMSIGAAGSAIAIRRFLDV